MPSRGERARRAIEDRLNRFGGSDGVSLTSEQVIGKIGDEPSDWATIAGALLHGGVSALSRPVLEAVGVLMAVALEETSRGHPFREQFVRYYGASQFAIAEQHDDVAVLDEAIPVLVGEAEHPAAAYRTRHLVYHVLEKAASFRIDRLPGAATTEGLIHARTRLIEMMPDEDPAKAEVMARLGSTYLDAHGFTGDRGAVDRAVEWTGRALDLAGEDHPRRGSMLYAAGKALRTRHKVTGDDSALAEAFRLTREAVRRYEDPDGWRWRGDLAWMLHEEHQRRHDLSVLDEEIEELRTRLTLVSEEGPPACHLRAGLGNALRTRYQERGHTADLTEAADLLRQAAAGLHDDRSAKATVLGNLSATLHLLYDRTGDEEARHEGIRIGREASSLSETRSAEHLRALNNLGVNQTQRFWNTGDTRALDEATRTLQRAMDATPEHGVERAVRLASLGQVVFYSFAITGDRHALDRSIAHNRDALTMLPVDHPFRPGVLCELGTRLQQRYLGFGDVDAIEEAVELLREAVSRTNASNPDWITFLANYSLALHALYQKTRRAETLDEAVDTAQRALEQSPPGYGGRAVLLSASAMALDAKYRETRDATLGRRARACYLAASQAPDAPGRQVTAAWRAAMLSAVDEQWGDAADALVHAVALLPRVASRRLARADQEWHLTGFSGLVQDACAYAMKAGTPERALTTLEQGRGILLTQTLENRDDFAELRGRHPDLADHLEDCRDGMTRGPDAPGHDQEYDTYHELAGRWDHLVADVRNLPGFERFLLPPRFADLRVLAEAGPVVTINVSEARSDAFVLTAGGLQVVALPGVTAEVVQERVLRFLDAVDPGLSSGLVSRRRDVIETLGWLWDTITGPVLDRLGITTAPGAGECWPRLWWCPTGSLAFLPLHAAGHHRARDRTNPPTVMDRVVSSYTPTMRALEHARRTGTSPDPRQGAGRVLAVAVPHAPGARDLPGALREVDALRDRLPGVLEELLGPAACRDMVLAEVSNHAWAHFACHATSDIDNPSAGHLLVHDHEAKPLTVGDIARLRLEHAEFAYLSACSTARTGMELADEVIHLASAFQLAGYRHVVATLWPISDRHAFRLTNDVYRMVVAEGASSAARAVHHATRTLRRIWPDHPELWAAHIHTGA